ncbi:unnamed protein product [Rhizopus stolonifer]
MTHLSDFSFLQRMVSFAYLYIWYTYRVWTLDRFQCLHPKRFQQGELKSIVTLLILFMIPFQLFYVMWTKADQSLVIPTEYSLCIGFSLQTGTLVLLQCFWNYLANSVAKASFMSSKEFMFYIFWTFASFIIFPVLQYNFSRDVYQATYKEIMPEMVYGIELFIVGCLGVVSHFRFKKLLNSSRDTDNGKSIVHKIRYFQEINLILSTVLFGHGTLLTILSCDGLTGRKYLNIHKFSADFFICNINMCAVITWLCMILIFHPKHGATQNNVTSEDNTYGEPISNQSGISSNYGQTTTLVIEHSQDSSDTYKEIHPLSKSGMSPSVSQANSEFHFGPLPTPPGGYVHRPNTSFSSNAPSINTLVSHNYGSQGKSRSKSYVPSDYYFEAEENTTPLTPFNKKRYTSDAFKTQEKYRIHDQDMSEFGTDMSFRKTNSFHPDDPRPPLLSPLIDSTFRQQQSYDTKFDILPPPPSSLPPPPPPPL